MPVPKQSLSMILRALVAVVLLGYGAALEAHDFGGQPDGSNVRGEPPKRPNCRGIACLFDSDDDEPCGKSSNPVELFTGAKSIQHTDLVVNGNFPIEITRHYDSQSTLDTPLGYGWAFTHDRRLYEYPDQSIVFRYGCGSRERFVLAGGNYVGEVGGVRATLAQQPNGTFVVTYATGFKDYFDIEGRLSAHEDPQGNRHEFTYDPRGRLPLRGMHPDGRGTSTIQTTAMTFRLTRIEERGYGGTSTGLYVDFTYNEDNGRLATVVDNAGRTITYETEYRSWLPPGVSPGCQFSTTEPTGNLRSVRGPGSLNEQWLQQFLYELPYCALGMAPPSSNANPYDDHRMTSAVGGIAATPLVKIEYDAQGRVSRELVGPYPIPGPPLTAYRLENTFAYEIPFARTVQTARDLQTNVARVTAYEFDSTGKVTKITDPLLNESRFIYNANKRLTRSETWQRNPSSLDLLQAVNYTHDAIGNVLTESVTLDSGETVTRTRTYDGTWVASEQVVSSLNPTKIFRTEYVFAYGADGRPTNVIEERERRDNGSFQTTVFGYDARRRLTSITLPDGVRSAMTYTGEWVTKEAVEIGGVEQPQLRRTMQYDARGNLTRIWDARNNLTEMTYGPNNMVATITDPRGEVTHLTWAGTDLGLAAVGSTSTASISNGATILDFQRNELAQLSTIRRRVYSGAPQEAIVETRTYNAFSDLTSVQAENFAPRTMTYDLGGRVITSSDGVVSTQYSYDAAGNPVRALDGLNNETTFEYDDLNRLTAVVERGVSPNLRTEYTYDAASNLTRIRDPKNQDTIYAFDALSRNTSVTIPGGQQVQYVYDVRDRLERMINARGQRVDYEYETWGPIKAVRHFASISATTPLRTMSYARDNEGNILSVTDTGVQATPIYTTTYDPLNRPYNLTVRYIPGGDKVLEYRYDRNFEVSALNLQDAAPVLESRLRDDLGRLTGHSFTRGAQAAGISPTYLGNFDRLTFLQIGAGGYVGSIGNANNRRDFISQIGMPGGPINYTYDLAGRVDTIVDPDGTHDFGFDGVSRLTTATHPSGLGIPTAESYAYDATGNREDPGNAAAYNYDSNDRITASPGLTYTSDADGNLATRSDGATFTHDVENRLVAFSRAAVSATYLHDDTGRRIRKIVGSQTTWFLWDGDRLIAEYDGSGTRTKYYGYLPNADTPNMLLDGGVWRSVHTDELGTPRVISTSDTAATVLWRARYESFGQAAINADVDGNGQSIEFNLRLPGQYYDAESGLHYNNQRSYDPATGRYIQTDPYGQYDHTNRYQYALNDPTGYTDPTGEFANVLVCTAACVAWESVTDPCFSPGKAAISCALDCLNPRKFLKLLRMADRLRKRTDGHHQITQEALKKLKERNRKGAYEAAKGRRGEPNIDEISRAEHKHRHRNQERYGPGGWQNHRVDKLIRDAGGYRNVTPAQIRRIREQVRREGRGGFL